MEVIFTCRHSDEEEGERRGAYGWTPVYGGSETEEEADTLSTNRYVRSVLIFKPFWKHTR